MSHITTVKTRWTDSEALRQALGEMGLTVTETVPRAEEEAAWLVRHPRWGRRTLRFARRAGQWDVDLDWSRWAHTLQEEDFFAEVGQRYAYAVVRAEMAAQGFEVVGEERDEAGRIRLLLRRAE
jgi:hypothetical protein